MPTTRFDLTGRVALVTGGTRGLGRSIAHGFAEAGARVAVNGRTPEACQSASLEIARATGAETLAAPGHLGSWDALPGLIDTVVRRFGRLDVLVNNAGINPQPMPVRELTEAYFDKLYAVNVKGPMRLAALAADQMARTGGGSIINVITVGAYIGGPGMAAYTSGKAALRNLTKVMAQEWAPLGIRVNALAPGSFMTDMMRGAGSIPGFLDGAANLSFQRRIADPDEIIGAALFLASDAGSFTTGSVVSVTGGVS